MQIFTHPQNEATVTDGLLNMFAHWPYISVCMCASEQTVTIKQAMNHKAASGCTCSKFNVQHFFFLMQLRQELHKAVVKTPT